MAEPTARQGQFLSFILGFTDKRGYAPSYEEIGWHFGLTAPSVNSMIKMLERRGFLSRMPGVARSLRVLVPAGRCRAATSVRPARSGGPGRSLRRRVRSRLQCWTHWSRSWLRNQRPGEQEPARPRRKRSTRRCSGLAARRSKRPMRPGAFAKAAEAYAAAFIHCSLRSLRAQRRRWRPPAKATSTAW